MSAEPTIPLFPLQLVLLPDMSLPLHIFEDKYKRMIGECLKQDKSFGIVFSDGKNIERVGCTAVITHVLNRYEDGRMDILTAGRDRFRIGHILDGKPYLEAEVRFFSDAEEETDGSLIDLARGALRELERHASLTGRDVDRTLLSKTGLEHLSFVVASIDGIPMEDRQRFLEMTRTRDRLRTGTKSLRSVVERLLVKGQLKKFFGNKDTGSEIVPL
jgi:Lon protease-like protein